MPYPALLGHVIPYHIDGTVVKKFNSDGTNQVTLSSDNMVELNDEDYTQISMSGASTIHLIFFFPEQREIQGIFVLFNAGTLRTAASIHGSNDSTNGYDGTWETASMPSGLNDNTANSDTWRQNSGAVGYKPVSFSGPKKVIKIISSSVSGGTVLPTVCHLYGKKGAGQTPNDIIFLDAENSDAPLETPLDFGDRPAGTTVVRQIKLQNTSATLTANTVDLQLNHQDFTFSTSPTGPWAAQLAISSLAPETKSSVIYVKNTTPIPPATLGPYRAPLILTVGSWT